MDFDFEECFFGVCIGMTVALTCYFGAWCLFNIWIFFFPMTCF